MDTEARFDDFVVLADAVLAHSSDGGDVVDAAAAVAVWSKDCC